ncbi:ferredoxin-NADP reductase [Methanocella sp. CWC-04]|uniref:Ferredoxin-NADP reductase n=1 Tax=Methanooceanicella nereidis TaxID=2052831 RepID=A0AAP2RCG1_9EURY|nr:ferredoxin-NADP reductase [Methanocella sp. CWC-04]
MYRIISKTELAEYTVQFDIEAPEVAKKARPGQFVVVRIDEKGERIPLTIADTDTGKGTVTIVVQSVGKTTGQLCSMEAGGTIRDFAGPLGNPTEMVENSTVVCIGGGLGIAPVYPIAKELKSRGNRVLSIMGARSEPFLFWEDRMRKASDEVYIATDDGSKGKKGFVTDALLDIINSGVKVDRVIAIGPTIMMKNVAKTTKPYNIKTIVSLNPIMVDGTGMCGSCRVTVGGKMKFSCVDGPEFDGHEVDFDELMARQKFYRTEEKDAMDKYTHEGGECKCLPTRS